MNHKDPRKTIHSQLFREVVNVSAFSAFVTTFIHRLGLNEGVQARLQIYLPCHLNTPRKRDAKIHKVIKCEAFMVTFKALNIVHKLASE